MNARRWSAVWLVMLAVSMGGCAAHAGDLPTVQVQIKNKPFTLEVASTEDQRERGLMFRDSMPEEHGMLFVFEHADKYAFWMHNTRIGLDIIFLDKDGKVVDIHHRKAYDETSMAPQAAALYVIELNAGMADKLGLKIGDTIHLPANELKAATAGAEK